MKQIITFLKNLLSPVKQEPVQLIPTIDENYVYPDEDIALSILKELEKHKSIENTLTLDGYSAFIFRIGTYKYEIRRYKVTFRTNLLYHSSVNVKDNSVLIHCSQEISNKIFFKAVEYSEIPEIRKMEEFTEDVTNMKDFISNYCGKMTDKEYIINIIDELTTKFTNIKVEYEYEKMEKTHYLQISPGSFFEEDNDFISEELRIVKEFDEMFKDVSIGFLSGNTISPLQSPEITKTGINYILK
jgi:hypothetical protein